MQNLNVFEVMQVLYKNQNAKAISELGVIEWVKSELDNPPKDKVKDLVYFNINGYRHNILRDIVIEQINYDIWTIKE